MPKFLDLIKGDGPAVQLIKQLISGEFVKYPELRELTGGEILEEVRRNGYVISKNTGEKVIEHLREEYLPFSHYLEKLDLEQLPSVAKIPKSITKILRNFSYKVQLSGTDIFTGDQRVQNVQVSSNQLLTQNQALSIAGSMVESGESKYGMNGVTGSVTEIVKNNDGLIF